MLIHQFRLKRAIALFFLLETVTQIAWPLASFALTSGPTAPEATSFEPIDTTDMVNLNSGDMTYSVPLLEVPSPEGGFPLALSYHAGIQMDEDASWVGLGWSLNPGSITRNVNGYPDDVQNASQTVRDTWAGGTRESTRVGATVGIFGTPASVSAGLSFSQDTYLGFGLGGYVGAGVSYSPLGKGSMFGIGANATVGTDGYGNNYGGVGIGLSAQEAGGVGGSLAVSTNFKNISASIGANALGTSLVGASISSTGGSPSFSVAGGSSSFRNDKAGIIQTEAESTDMGLPLIPGLLSVSLGLDYIRYWSDETTSALVSGTLYYPKSYNASEELDNHDYDTYHLLDPTNEGVLDNPDPDYLQGGSFPSYDNYSVQAQGLAGAMRPYSFQTGLYSKNRKATDGNYIIKDQPLTWTNKAVSFRFENDFSNQYRQTNGVLSTTQSSVYSFDPNPIKGQNGGGYDVAKDQLAGSKHIEWFSNTEISNGTAKQRGFISNIKKIGDATSLSRGRPEQIGGFMITNASGVTYHFAQPAYSYNEKMYSQSVGKGGISSNTITKYASYAYTWFLTGITGPDYVDRNNDGLLSSEDWGYWVAFDYGQWTDNFQWRTPAAGFRRDIDGRFTSYSTGYKEVFYLNSIRTRTHTALFEKEIRADGKGVGNDQGYNDSFFGKTISNRSTSTATSPQYGDQDITYNLPKTALKLKRIYLLNNKDVPANIEANSATGYYFQNWTSTTRVFNPPGITPAIAYHYNTFICDHHFGKNVFDVNDSAPIKSQLESASVRIIEFNYNYSLADKTPNSFDANGYLYAGTRGDVEPSTDNNNKLGKLTLMSLSYLGAGGISLLPNTRFSYELNKEEQKAQTITILSGETGSFSSPYGRIQGSANVSFEPGEILTLATQGRQIYCSILDRQPTIDPNSAVYSVVFYNNIYPSPGSYPATTTKNPPYVADFYDVWGSFKSDLDYNILSANENIARRTSSVSAKSVDVWSLRSITSPLGSTIDFAYESDDYKNVVLEQPQLLASFGLSDSQTTPASDKQAQEATRDGVGVIGLANLPGKISNLVRRDQWITVSGVVVTDYSGCEYIPTNGESLSGRAVKVRLQVDHVQDTDNSGRRINWVYLRDPNSLVFRLTGCGNTITSNNFTHLVLGHLELDPNTSVKYGGGIRVKSISLLSNRKRHRTLYFYDEASDGTGASSGTTSIEPGSVTSPNQTSYNYYKERLPVPCKAYQDSYYKDIPSILAIGREMPGPGVLYEKVTVREEVVHPNGQVESVPSSIVYRFQMFHRDMLNLTVPRFTTTGNPEYRTQSMAIQDMTAAIGSVKSITRYGAGTIKLTETVNQFAQDGITSPAAYEQKLVTYNYQGVIQESFGDCRQVLRPDGRYDTKVVMSKREVYPTIQTGSTTTDYTTGISTSTRTLGFDFYSGAPTRTVAVDGYGNRFLTETTPAYRKYPKMGLKVADASNRHMLTQQAASITYKVNATNTPVAVVASTSQTWSDGAPIIGLDPNNPEQKGTQPNIWRPAATYAWMPTSSTSDGLTALAGNNAFVPFNFSSTATPAAFWKKVSEITLYNPYSNALEAKDINNMFLATKMGFSNSKVLLSGGPAQYEELAYCGAEEKRQANESFSGNVWATWNNGRGSSTDGIVSTDAAHTGKQALLLHGQKHGFSYEVDVSRLDPAKPYRACVWANRPEVQLYYWVNGQERKRVSGSTQRKAGNWYLITLDIPALGTRPSSFRVGCYNSLSGQDAYLDDFRFQPANAQTAAYVYDQLTGQVTDILDNDNLFTHYDYDAAGKLRRVTRETLQYGPKPVAEHEYQYATLTPLDMVALQVPPMGSGLSRTFQATLSLPSSLVGRCTINYATGSSSGTLTNPNSTTPVFTCIYPAAGTYWIKVTVQDQQGTRRELAQKVNVR